MQTEVLSEQFPLLSAASPETLEWLMSVATEHEYPPGRAVLMEDSWGNAVYFIASGWVKVRRLSADGEAVLTMAILGKGDFFGEMAILDESPRSTDVIALSSVKLVKDSQLHHRMLQLMVRRLRMTNFRFQLRHQPAAVKLANTLVNLSGSYGTPVGAGVEIFNIPSKDLADVTDISLEETAKIMDKLQEKGWLKIDAAANSMHLVNLPQLSSLAKKLS
jgi:CRP/FNR family transcriptional regulator, cyclic AMP receptor protein